ncbi:MAG: putative colanic acid biosynthesis acetyltransferase [Planctomycetes bacterium]|nr:putative colanic acid biosynthesis acetyltransferase [Planctomycetota bacterium]
MSGVRQWLWQALGRRAFALCFHNWYGPRRAILRMFGAKLTPTSRLRPSCIITHPWNLSMGIESAVGDLAYLDCTEPIEIGDYCTVSQHVRVLTHVPGAPAGVSHQARGPVRIERDGWVAAESMVLPGVTVGEGAILGARGTARESLAPWSTYGGDPLRRIGDRARPV